VFVLVEDDDKKDMRVKKRITKRKRSHQLHFIHAFSHGRLNLFRHRPSTSSFRVLLLSAVNGNLSSLLSNLITKQGRTKERTRFPPALFCSGFLLLLLSLSIYIWKVCVREREREREREGEGEGERKEAFFFFFFFFFFFLESLL